MGFVGLLVSPDFNQREVVGAAGLHCHIEEQIAAVHEAQKVIYSKGPTWFPLVTPYGYTVYSNKVHNLASGLGPATNALANIASWIEA